METATQSPNTMETPKFEIDYSKIDGWLAEAILGRISKFAHNDSKDFLEHDQQVAAQVAASLQQRIAELEQQLAEAKESAEVSAEVFTDEIIRWKEIYNDANVQLQAAKIQLRAEQPSPDLDAMWWQAYLFALAHLIQQHSPHFASQYAGDMADAAIAAYKQKGGTV